MATLPSTDISERYAQERDKRLRPDGTSQFIELSKSSKYKHLETDPWVDHAALNAATHVLSDGDDVKFLILGAGFGGLILAARLIEAGFAASDIRLVDAAGGFGGTWYWNRYPGLMCDVESYIYMPLLEETGYMPKFKYAYGDELREHAERIAAHYRLQASLRTVYHSAEWREEEKHWTVKMREDRGPGEPERSFSVSAQFVFLGAGAIIAPQIPSLPGFDDFKGATFHTARWNYSITGGSPGSPTMDKLKDKRVGIIGTGATAIQVVPELAKWAKELFVFQRTPSSVDVRNQHPTDPDEWRNKIATGQGWQHARSVNYNAILINEPEDGPDLVSDAWCQMPAYCGIIGAPGIVTPEKIPEHIAKLHSLDLPRAERVRARVDEIVKDPETAAKLKAWYPVWCKRPTFHDEYLPAFNRPNVTLVDTDGKGVDALSADGVVANGIQYPVDVLVLSTGYVVTFAAGTGSPASRGTCRITGANGRDMDDKWIEEGCGTLHGIASSGFPNMFFLPGLSQLGFTANFTFPLNATSKHIAAIIAQAQRVVGGTERPVIEVEKSAEDAWTAEVVKRAAWFAAVPGCTPGYFNLEGGGGRPQSMADQLKAAQSAVWGEGIVSYTKILEEWQAEGGLKGFNVTA
ncbi:unnamed protein product [Mycena citricolor]|uniref:FAD/NAD(P)-binding domain-containing protein n=1 Tax=Mycena citricolor TaxID=2018698 RepID=A0AAD2H4Z3_9AGAR|nr:unnamed protein product [Mycena citricolor]